MIFFIYPTDANYLTILLSLLSFTPTDPIYLQDLYQSTLNIQCRLGSKQFLILIAYNWNKPHTPF